MDFLGAFVSFGIVKDLLELFKIFLGCLVIVYDVLDCFVSLRMFRIFWDPLRFFGIL